ncbi:MAG: hypothetical protein JW966_06160 [Anaerolineae bacterium]|nr:hypothetical protein [Anaerolineae bacterium]
MQRPDLFPLLGDTRQALGTLYNSVIQDKVNALDLGDGPEWFLLAGSHDFEPDAVSAAKFAKRAPYTSPQAWRDGLASLAEKGFLYAVNDTEYRLTDKAHTAIDDINNAVASGLATPDALDAADVDRAVTLLGRLVDACLEAPEPAHKIALPVNRHSDPGPDGPPLLRILQYLADLNCFRDDSHMAAWQPVGVSGHVWETLTFIWKNEAHTAEELADKLPRRNYDAADYTAALATLESKGWVTFDSGTYQITEAGKTMRQDVEDLTDRYYYGPWAVLSDAEVNELGGLLARLSQQIDGLAENAT